jgi:UDP-N-acetylmuramoyl-tripeptide--D-alanyl-D-alanine ligase
MVNTNNDAIINKIYEKYLISGKVTTDSRNVPQGSIFFALKGDKFDGNKFAQQAIDNGADFCVISDKNYEIKGKTFLVEDTLKALQKLAKTHRNNLKINTIGITGSNGKTTTKELVKAVLSQKYKTLATQGNLNNHIGVPLTILSLDNTYEYAVVEMGANHIGEIAELCDIAQPNYGIITNIGFAHLEGFGSLENLINTKLALFDAVKKQKGTFLLNADDKYLTNYVKNYDKIIKFGYSTGDLVKVIEEFNELFIKLVVKINNENHLIKTQLVGKYNISNILAAITIGLTCGISADNAITAIENYKPANNRSELRKTNKNTLILDMYNANPTSMKASIENFAEIDLPRKMLIIGDMLELGKNEQEEHQKIINLIEKLAFKDVVLIGKIFASCSIPENYIVFETIDDFIKNLQQNPIKNYSILLKASNGTGLKKCVEYL